MVSTALEPYRTGVPALLVLCCLGVSPAIAEPAARPVVLVHGFDSHPEIWRGTELVVRDAGREPLFIHWSPPEAGADTARTAREVLLPSIERTLAEAGHGPDAPFDVITHSMGGLMMRLLLEQPEPGREIAHRVGALAMLSPPHHGAGTGVARIGCDTYRDPVWRPLVCDLVMGSPFLAKLGRVRPDLPTRYLSVGVATATPWLPLPVLYDGDGDGVAAGHDNAVLAESGWLEGDADFVVWRGLFRSDHFRAPCSSVVNRWLVDFIVDGTVPTPPRGRMRDEDQCAGLSKADWRRAHGHPVGGESRPAPGGDRLER